jgi:hypothetical protein
LQRRNAIEQQGEKKQKEDKTENLLPFRLPAFHRPRDGTDAVPAASVDTAGTLILPIVQQHEQKRRARGKDLKKSRDPTALVHFYSTGGPDALGIGCQKLCKFTACWK